MYLSFTEFAIFGTLNLSSAYVCSILELCQTVFAVWFPIRLVHDPLSLDRSTMVVVKPPISSHKSKFCWPILWFRKTNQQFSWRSFPIRYIHLRYGPTNGCMHTKMAHICGPLQSAINFDTIRPPNKLIICGVQTKSCAYLWAPQQAIPASLSCKELVERWHCPQWNELEKLSARRRFQSTDPEEIDELWHGDTRWNFHIARLAMAWAGLRIRSSLPGLLPSFLAFPSSSLSV